MDLKSESSHTSDFVTNVFTNGRMPTKEEYTKFWIQLINQMERSKAEQP